MSTQTRAAFTFIELIVVLLILGTLCSFAIPRYEGFLRTARLNVFLANIGEIRNTLEVYRAKYLKYPASLVELEGFIKNPVNPYTNKKMLNTDPLESGIVYNSDKIIYSLCIIQSDVDDINKNKDKNEPLPVTTEDVCGNQMVYASNGRSIKLATNPPNAGTPIILTNDINVGDTVTLLDNPNACYKFDGWLSSDVTISDNKFVMPNQDVVIVANYIPLRYTIAAVPDNLSYGIVSGAGTYICGEQVVLTAMPIAGVVFDGWYENGNQVAATATYTFTATSDRILEARFMQFGVITIAERTPTDFQTGTLTDVNPTSNGLVLNQRNMLGFSGTAYVHIPILDNVNFKTSTIFTIEMIINANSVTATQYLFSINRTAENSKDQASFLLVPNGSGASLVFWDYSNGYGFSPDKKSTVILQPNQTYHVAFVRKGKNGTYYVDGEEAGTTKAGKNINKYGNKDVYLGIDYPNNDKYYNGYMSEVRIWGTARSKNDIQANMNRKLSGNEKGLVAYWKLNEGNGNTVYDSTPNHSDGTIYGTQLVTSGYTLSGTRVSPVHDDIAAPGTVDSTRISWTANTPEGTLIKIETSVSLDGGATWSDWQPCTNGGTIPGLAAGTDLTNARIQMRQTLSTTDSSVTPELQSVTIQVVYSPLQ
mgnify:CR=1 FL=1